MSDNSAVKQALFAIREQKARVAELERARTEPIAIVGIGCRYPGGVNDPDSFWDLLESGRDAVGKIPESRFGISNYYDPDTEAAGKVYTDQGGYVDEADKFDAEFFGISPREAKSMDPQQRVVMEVCWEALEDGGIPGDSLKDSATGVYVGMTFNDYQQRQDHVDDLTLIDTYTGTGSYHNVVAGRVSYFLGLQGPCMVTDMACASSLGTVHLASQALRTGEVDLALAGGVHLMFSPDTYVALARTRALSPTGRCQTFSAKADGYIRSEGCGMLALKRLSDALRDGDRMYAVIRGSAIRQDGASSGLTVPSGPAQQELIKRTLKFSGVSPHEVDYIEAHGTGTPLGDPIEFWSLAGVMKGRQKEQPLVISSVKTNIGHTEAAAGVAGIIKTVLALKNETIPKHLHYDPEAGFNPEIKLEQIPAEVPVEGNRPWKSGERRRIAGVSSFGFSGVIAHVVLEEAPAAPAESNAPEQTAHLLPLSAATPGALREMAAAYRDWLRSDDAPHLYDLCAGAAFRRANLPHRITASGTTAAEIAEALDAYVQEQDAAGLATGTATLDSRSKLGFVFSGQGPQWWAMGRELYESEPVFRAKIDEIAELLKKHTTDWNLIKELQAAEDASHLDQTEIAQPAIFAVQVALATVLQERGIKPRAVVGHSVGEIAAAHVSGTLSLEDSVKVIYHRARLMQAATGLGKMAAVDRPPETLSAHLSKYAGRLELGAHNSPISSVLSGEEVALNEVLEILKKEGVPSKMLPVNYAFHSPQMEPFARELQETLEGLTPVEPVVPIYSTARGGAAEKGDYDAAYWFKNVRGAVHFSPAIAAMAEDGIEAFVEISPHPVLSHYVRQILEKEESGGVAIHTLRRNKPELPAILSTIGGLHCAGYPIDWKSMYPRAATFIDLPKYPFQRKRHWLDFLDEEGGRRRIGGADDHPFLGRRLGSPLAQVQFEAFFDAENPRFLGDHLLYGTIVVPGASHISMVLSAAREIFTNGTFILESVNFFEPVVVPDEEYRKVQLVFTPADGGSYTFQVHSCGQDEDDTDAENWILHGKGELRVDREAATPKIDGDVDLEAVKQRCGDTHPGSEFYADFYHAGYHLGQRFEWIADNWWREGEVLCRMEAPPPVVEDGNVGDYELYPSLIDSIFQLLTAGFPEGGVSMMFAENDGPGDIYVPFAANSFTYYGHTGKELWCHGVLHEGQTKRLDNGAFREIFTGDLVLFDEEGTVVADVKNINLKRAPKEALLRAIQKKTPEWIYRYDWESNTHSLSEKKLEGNWLIFADDDGLAGGLVAEKPDGAVLVKPGAAFKEVDANTYEVDPASAGDFEQLFQKAFGDGQPDGIMYLWSLRAGDFAASDGDAVARDTALVYRSLLYLGQGLNKAGWKKFPRLYLVSRGAQQVASGDTVDPVHSGLWGFGRVIALEYPDIRATMVDLDPANWNNPGLLLHTVATDIDANQIVYREGRTYTPQLEKTRNPKADGPRSFPEDACYLITGGLGGLGLRIARWLGEQGAKHVVLTGRREPNDDAKSVIKELETDGIKVTVALGDIGKADDVAKIFAQMDETGSKVRGVFHAAGVVDDGMLVQQDWARFEKVMGPKITGTWNLHEATRERDMDHFVLYSSISGMLGNAGQANYAAANTFMDGLAEFRRAQNLPALSIPWGPWAEVGMAAGMDETSGKRWKEAGLIGPDQGMELMGLLMDSDYPVAAVLPFRWPKYFEQFPNMARLPVLANMARSIKKSDDSADEEGGSALLAEIEGLPANEQQEKLVDHVSEQLRKVMGLDESKTLDPRQGLFEMGLDSLMTVELRNRLQATIGQPLSTTLTFDYPNIAAIAGYIGTDVLELAPAEDPEAAAAAAAAEKKAEEAKQRQAEIESMSTEAAENKLADLLSEFE